MGFAVLMKVFSCVSLIGLFALMTSCGGGGGGGGSPTTTSNITLAVTPALGGVSAGVNVAAFDSQTGAQLGVATTTIVDGLGTANIPLPASYKGIAVIKVNGCSTCSYLDERTMQPASFGEADSLLAVLPSVSSSQDRSVGVSALTSMAAAKLGVTPTNFDGSSFSPPVTQITATSLNAAVSTVLDVFGISSNDSSNVDLMFSKPVVYGVSSKAEDKLSGTGSSLNIGVLLTALAKSTPVGTPLIKQSSSLSQVLYQSFQDPSVNVKTNIASGNLISDFSSKLNEVKQKNLDAASSLDTSLIAKVEQASKTISSSSSSSSSSSGSGSGSGSGTSGNSSSQITPSLIATVANSNISAGLSTQIQVVYKSNDGTSSVVPTSSLTYTSSNLKVLTVTKSGLVNAMGPGQASIVINYQDKNVSVDITVPNGVYPNGFSGQAYN